MSHSLPALARYRGALLGLAAGDALGTTLEFRAPGSFRPITGIESFADRLFALSQEL